MSGLRRTIVVHTRLAGHMTRVEAARARSRGIQILTMSQLAARLAGGFIAPIDPESLQVAVREALPGSQLGELENIKTLPGMARAATSTFDKAWRAGIVLSASSQPRLQALARLAQEVLRRLPPSMKQPQTLVDLARARIAHAPAVLGPVEVRGHSEMPICWRPLLHALADVVPVTWIAGPRGVPDWLDPKRVKIQRSSPTGISPTLYSCATPQHEALEAFRWLRSLIAEGKARPEEIAIVAASPADFDDHMLALSQDANLPIHFVHGIKAVTTPDGQTAAALADVLAKGISQDRVRRLFRRLDGTPAVAGLPSDWPRVLPKDAPLSTVERWKQAFSQVNATDWPEGADRSRVVLDILELLKKGPAVAAEAGEKLLHGLPRRLWERALADGPAAALPVTLSSLRLDDGLEAAAHPIWGSAISLAAAPRPYVRLLSLNAGRWPRRISEDRLIPDHIIPVSELDPLPIAEGDRQDFATIIASAREAAISFSRRDVEGRLLGRSPLIAQMNAVYLSRGRVPEHAASGSDRLMARPSEFQSLAMAKSAVACWQNWLKPELTPSDGLVGRAHPRLLKVFKQPLSATSLKLLLRDPIRFVWHYALGWDQPDQSEEPFTLDPTGFGSLVHQVLQAAVDILEPDGGLGKAGQKSIEKAVEQAVVQVGSAWEREQPVPPPIIWRNVLESARDLSIRALSYGLPAMPGQKSWTELPFGMQDSRARNDLPWDPAQPIALPKSGIIIRGRIDRLDLSGDGNVARVIDYKSGAWSSKAAEKVVDGGSELQRCLYAFAVQTLLGSKVAVEAALLYPRAPEGEQALFPLPDVNAALTLLSNAFSLARNSLESGLALPGVDASDQYNDFAFALPASAGYLPRKQALAAEQMGDASKIWDAD